MLYEELKLGTVYDIGGPVSEFQLGVKDIISEKLDLITSPAHYFGMDQQTTDSDEKAVLNFCHMISGVKNGCGNYRDFMGKEFRPVGEINISSLRSLDSDLEEMARKHFKHLDSDGSFLGRQLVSGSFENGETFRLILPRKFSEKYSLK